MATADMPIDSLGLLARSHPLRATLSHEMHLRQMPAFQAPARFLQIVVLIDDATGATVRELIDAHRSDAAAPLPGNARHAVFRIGDHLGLWERHSEFATIGVVHEGAFDDPFDLQPFDPVRALVADLPAAVIRATLVALAPAADEARMAGAAARRFQEGGLVLCDVESGRARIWSDFRFGADGLGQLLIVDRGLAGEEPAQLVQRLQELGNYRNMALLGLPVAQRLGPELARLEQELAGLTARVAERDQADEPLLGELTAVSAEIARLLAESRYRMSATEAYAKIVEERLARLTVTPLAGTQTLTDFTDRRLVPAVRTCATVTRRLDDLSLRAAQASSLLRTRIDTALARQNRDLLGSMDRRTRLQLRLQQAVEGLSVVAISYYLVALLAYVLKPWKALQPDVALAIGAPLILILTAMQMIRLKKRLRE